MGDATSDTGTEMQAARASTKEVRARLAAAVLFAILVTVAASACTPPNVAPALPTYADAAGKDVAPLTVDWPAGRRADLEVAMREGLPLVRFDGGGFELLQGCRVPGNYGFISTSIKEEVLRLESSTEVMANLPFGGAGIVGKVGADLGQKTTLDVGLVMVGKRMSTRQEGAREQIVGPADCKRATHFVRGVTVGAFALASSARGEVKAVASLFAVTSQVGKESANQLHAIDGNVEACRKASVDSEEPPKQCSAVLRLDLRAFGRETGPRDGAVSPRR